MKQTRYIHTTFIHVRTKNLLLRLRSAPLFSISARAFLNGVGVRGVVSNIDRLILGVLNGVFFSLL